MSMWLAIRVVALGSYMFRVIPMLLGERVRLSERADATLQHAAVGAITALLVLGVKHAGGDAFGTEMVAACLAVTVSSAVALKGRSMLVVVLFGGATYGVALFGFATLAA